MSMIERKNIDVSEQFKSLAGTVFITHIITLPDITAALIVDHSQKKMYVYEYKEGELSISLSPIEDDEVREGVQGVVNYIISKEREE
jgi:hypothetical protein